jgi:hypothetical protein
MKSKEYLALKKRLHDAFDFVPETFRGETGPLLRFMMAATFLPAFREYGIELQSVRSAAVDIFKMVDDEGNELFSARIDKVKGEAEVTMFGTKPDFHDDPELEFRNFIREMAGRIALVAVRDFANGAGVTEY